MTVLVLGAGVSGVAALRLARRRGVDAVCYDERPDASLPLDLAEVEFHRGNWNPELLAEADRIVASPGFAPHSPPLRDAEAAGVSVVTEAGFGLEGLSPLLVAVTGTNGKSTVVTQTAAMLTSSGVSAVAAGNIGDPISNLVDAPGVIVAELSSFQLAYMDVHPAAAAILNIAPDHLDWHGSLEAYASAKASVTTHMRDDDVFIANVDDPRVAAIAESARCTVIECSAGSVPAGGNGVDGDDLVVEGVRYPAPIQDPSYRFDLVVAASLALAVGATSEGVATTLQEFRPGEHRRNVVADIGGVQWVNDSKATNPHAAVAAATSYDSVRLLAGGRNKDLDLTQIGSVPSVQHIYAFGESAALIASTSKRPVSIHASMRHAMEAARAEAAPGDVVLLSPGCTSFDEFTSYAERGRTFEALVHAMKGDADDD